MAKKNLQSVAAALKPVATSLPTQNVQPTRPPKAETPGSAEPSVQFAFELRKSLRKELARLSADADMTMRAFVLNALKEQGLTVTDDDLEDLRKGKR